MSVGFCMSIIFVFGMIAVILERRYAIATVISGGIEEVKKEQSQNPGVHIHVGGDGAVVLGDGQATVNKPITMPKSDEGLQELLAQLQKHFEDVQKSPSTTISDKEKEMAADAHDDLKKAIESKKESKFDVTAEGLKGAATAVAGAFPAIFEVLQKIKELVFK